MGAIRDVLRVPDCRRIGRGTSGVGDGFGEIALLRDIPRTATITAIASLRTYSLTRDEFLVAIGSSRLATATAVATADDRLAADRAVQTNERGS